MNILRNRYVRVFLAAGLGATFAPKVSKLLDWTVPELSAADGLLNDLEFGTIVGVLAGVTAVALSAAFGVPESDGGATPAPAGGAS